MPAIANGPDDDEDDGGGGAPHRQQESGIGRGDQQVDRRVIEASQPPFQRRHRPKVIGRREAEHRQKCHEVDRDRCQLGDIALVHGNDGQHRGAADRDGNPQDVDHPVDDGLAAVIIPGKFGAHGARILVQAPSCEGAC
jgi:hypothetical protein